MPYKMPPSSFVLQFPRVERARSGRFRVNTVAKVDPDAQELVETTAASATRRIALKQVFDTNATALRIKIALS